MTQARVKLLTPSAQMPQRGSAQAAGLDVRADLLDHEGNPRVIKVNKRFEATLSYVNHPDGDGYGFLLRPGERALIPTGIAMMTTPDVYTRIAPRSGLAWSHGIDVFAGVVDADYNSEIGCVLYNADPHEAFLITHGMRIAQLVLTSISLVDPEQVQTLDATARGAGGFGSTGTV